MNNTIRGLVQLARGFNFSPKNLTQIQSSGARSTGGELNYNSVNTLDPSRLATAFKAADSGDTQQQAQFFEMIEEQDAHIYAELSKRRRAVTGLGWSIKPPRDATEGEIKRAEELGDILRETPQFEDAQYDLTDAIGKGFCPLEIEWQTGDLWRPKAFHYVPQRAFKTIVNPDSKQREIVLLKDGGQHETLRQWGWMVHEHRAKSGYIEAGALFRVLAWTYAYKAYNVKDLQRFLEVYGLPLRVGKFPAGIGKTERDELLRAVRNIGSDSGGIIPSTMQIDFVESKIGKVDDFIAAIKYWESKQSMAILGGTLTSQADGKTSTNALGEVHNEVRREILLHDVRQIEPTINNQLIRPICLINGLFPDDRLPTFSYDTSESVDQKTVVEVLKIASEMGMQISLEYAHTALQIPMAAEGDTVLSAPKNPTPSSKNPSAPLTAALTLADSGSVDSAELTQTIAQQLAQLTTPLYEKSIQQIAQIVANADDYDSALAQLSRLTLPPTDKEQLIQTLAEAMTVAHLAGRDSVPPPTK